MFRNKRVHRITGIIAALAVFFVLSGTAFAQEEDVTGQIIVQIDIIWLFIGSFLVFWMQVGFAMVESGFSRGENTANLLMKNLMDFSMAAILFYAVGFGLMYGADKAGIIETSNFFLSDFGIEPMTVNNIELPVFQNGNAIIALETRPDEGRYSLFLEQNLDDLHMRAKRDFERRGIVV
ncbi:MAG: hypothetical protein GY796_05165 [Chloroflexi bacterium]|nr:hypothetical protein [Chloroflexota bacterium]